MNHLKKDLHQSAEAHTSTVAIVGDGAGALIAYAVLLRAGLGADEITIFGDAAHPLAPLMGRAQAVGQRSMRSEGNGHLAPHDAPGLALVDAWQRRSPLPLLAALLDAYTPSLELLAAHTAALAAHCSFEQRHVASRVGRIERCATSPRFIFWDEQERPLGAYHHVLLALGHPGYAWPAAVHAWCNHPRVTHAYGQRALQPGDRVAIIGGGMAAAHCWIEALEQGATVTAVHRSPLHRQRLNAPRCAFSTASIAAFQGLSPDQRTQHLAARRASFPFRPHWEYRLWQARRQGRFVTHMGALAAVEDDCNDTSSALQLLLVDGTHIKVDHLICATGFVSDATMHPLVRQMVTDYQLAHRDGMLQIGDDFSLPQLSNEEGICAVVGALARWALPVADTFMGMKYAARRIAPQIVAARNASRFVVEEYMPLATLHDQPVKVWS